MTKAAQGVVDGLVVVLRRTCAVVAALRVFERLAPHYCAIGGMTTCEQMVEFVCGAWPAGMPSGGPDPDQVLEQLDALATDLGERLRGADGSVPTIAANPDAASSLPPAALPNVEHMVLVLRKCRARVRGGLLRFPDPEPAAAVPEPELEEEPAPTEPAPDEPKEEPAACRKGGPFPGRTIVACAHAAARVPTSAASWVPLASSAFTGHFALYVADLPRFLVAYRSGQRQVPQLCHFLEALRAAGVYYARYPKRTFALYSPLLQPDSDADHVRRTALYFKHGSWERYTPAQVARFVAQWTSGVPALHLCEDSAVARFSVPAVLSAHGVSLVPCALGDWGGGGPGPGPAASKKRRRGPAAQ